MSGTNLPTVLRHNRIILLLLTLWGGQVLAADWPMVRGEPGHAGFVSADLKPPFRLAWARDIQGERLGTAMEPIVSRGKVFVATHKGNVYALDAQSGDAVWRFEAHGPFLNSPAVAGELVIAASSDGNIYAIVAESGKLQWHYFGGGGGFSAAPTVERDEVYIGTRAGELLTLDARDGRLLWSQNLGAPIRQTAAVADGQVFVTAEDLKVRGFRAADGKPLWTSEQLPGQTARDYFPVVVGRGKRRYIIVRTNPVLNMGQRIAQDRGLLCRQAGVDDSAWQQIEAWIKSDKARGTPELWQREQTAIVRYLETNQTARSFFVLDAATGKEAFVPPVLWIGGCQGVGAPPALTADGELLVFYRSAYGNWNQGVALLVGLGLLDLEANKIKPLFHQQGSQPAWNCFWGTADESQNFLVACHTVLIVHQGTLSGFDLQKNELFPIWGKRDTYGGFRNPPWARNEWHGPARSGVAVCEDRIFWQTGSRVLCLVPGRKDPGSDPAKPVTISGVTAADVAPMPPSLERAQVQERLTDCARSVPGRKWAPLFTDPGLAGRVFCFQNSAELFESLAWAYPHLPSELQSKTKELMEQEWKDHPPFTAAGDYSLSEGELREWFSVPSEYRQRLGTDRPAVPFGNLYAVWLFAQRCHEEQLVLKSWPQLKRIFEDFMRSGWRLDAAKGDPFANRYLASLLAVAHISEEAQDGAAANEAQAKAKETLDALVVWWKRAAEHPTLRSFNTSAELDPFISKGDGLFLAVAPHRHVIGLFQDLTPEVAALVRERAPAAADRVWGEFESLCPTWWLMGEERQVHFGENFVDPPGFAVGAFRAAAWLKQAPAGELARCVDLPFCRADLYYLLRLALVLEGS